MTNPGLNSKKEDFVLFFQKFLKVEVIWRPNGKRCCCFSITRKRNRQFITIGAPGLEKLTMALKCEKKISGDL